MRSRVAVWLALSVGTLGQQVEAVSEFPRFTVADGALDRGGVPVSGAKVCVGAANCFVMPSGRDENGKGPVYEFGLAPRVERLVLAQGGSLVFFSAQFSAGGSGSSDRLAVLRFEGGRMVNLLPEVTLSNISERAMWTLPEISGYPVLVDADFSWDFKAGETHFDPHRFVVEGWRYDPGTSRYEKAFSYKTVGKYDSEKLGVLRAEREEILRRLKEGQAHASR